jgi:hypothetical protein
MTPNPPSISAARQNAQILQTIIEIATNFCHQSNRLVGAVMRHPLIEGTVTMG